MPSVRIFGCDPEALRTTIEELCEALDMVGFPRPLEAFHNDESPLCSWLLSVESKDPERVFEELKENLDSLQQTCQQRAQPGSDLNKALQFIRMAAEESLEAFTFEE